MKIKYIKLGSYIRQLILFSFTSLIFFNIRISPQIKPEFIISDSAFVGDMEIDDYNNIHIVLDRREDIIYGRYDSLLNPISYLKTFSNTSKTSNPKFAIRNNYMVTVWRDFKLLMFFNSEIVGNISNLAEGGLNPNNFFINEEYYDAHRGSPEVCFINDTTFFVIWSGNGPYTITNSGIYGRIFSITGEPITPDILLVDRYNDTSRSVLPKIVNSRISDKLFITWVSNFDKQYRLWGRLFYSDGTPVASSFSISEGSFVNDLFYYDTQIDPSGNFVAAWAIAKDSLTWELQWKWFNENGEPLTQVETISSAEDSLIDYSYVNIDFSENGNFVLSWNKKNNNKLKIYIKRFYDNRNPIDNTFYISENDSLDEIKAVFLLRNEKVYCIWDAIGYKWYGSFGDFFDFDNPTLINEDKKKYGYPNAFCLHQNYPNPFNPNTTISYSITEKGHVNVSVFDILGREIAELVNEDKESGTYTITFDGHNLSSGVYICTMAVNDYKASTKLILAK
ncbi:MAG: T9SS type A sorting domain-containing protein [Ignavibacteriaceae bacterium]|nr:T9SS type A sorting domain-containing protein [Ignavibacteriaceae bacterium]